MRKTVRKVAVLLMSVAIATFIASPVTYASSADIGIEPAYPKADNERTQSIFIMTLKPGEQASDGIHIVNSGKEAHTVEIYSTDSSSSVDGSFSCRQHAEAVKDVGKWVNLEKTKLTLEAGQQAIVNFSLVVPKGTGPGEHDGCIAVQDTANLPAKTGSGVLLGFRSAIRLAVTVPGKIVKHLTIKNVEVKHVANRGVSISPVAKNSGNVSLDVTARAQLVSIFGQETEVKSDAKYPIMQGATTGWAYVFDGPYWGGIYKARTSLSYNANPNSGIGQDVTNQQRVRKDSEWFVAYPAPLAGFAELAVLLSVVWLILTPLRRHMQRKKVSKHWQQYVVTEGDTLMSVAKRYDMKWKQLARHNRIKAPYLLETGKVLSVPSKHNRKARRALHSAESEWLSSDEQVNPVQPSVPQPTVIETPESQAQAEEPAALEWYTPGNATIATSRPPVSSIPKKQSSPNPLFPEPDDMPVLDWREGATEDELRQFGVIPDSSSVSGLDATWNIDEEESQNTKKNASKRRLTATKAKKTPRTTKKKSS